MNGKLTSIVIIIPYFGKWPEWFDFFLKSCEFNSTIDWIFFTDCEMPKKISKNLKFYNMSFDEYKNIINRKLNINIENISPYKLCDVKPSYGLIHYEYISKYDFYGYGDLDLVYGDIRKIITEDILRHDVISTHSDRLSGHLALFRNTKKNREAFRKIPQWKHLYEMKEHVGIDEGAYSRIFRRRKKASKLYFFLMWFLNPYQRNICFEEQYTTILAPIKWLDNSYEHPETWYWINGTLTNIKDGERGFLYLHFMNWKSNTWLPKESQPAKWTQVKSIINFKLQNDDYKFMINDTGFHRYKKDV